VRHEAGGCLCVRHEARGGLPARIAYSRTGTSTVRLYGSRTGSRTGVPVPVLTRYGCTGTGTGTAVLAGNTSTGTLVPSTSWLP
jgi:hypothetical protein